MKELERREVAEKRGNEEQHGTLFQVSIILSVLYFGIGFRRQLFCEGTFSNKFKCWVWSNQFELEELEEFELFTSQPTHLS